MKINTADFLISAVKPEQYPDDGLAEFAFVGRSNVGKSSLINTITNRKKLVKVSGTPGKTRLINFFTINERCYFVDLPGYGYAKVSKTEQAKWGKMMERYLLESEQLKKIILLIDSRHEPTEDDILMYNWIRYYEKECLIVATKKDKLKKNDIKKSEKRIRDGLGLHPKQKIIFFSALKKIGIETLLKEIEKDVIIHENETEGFIADKFSEGEE